MAEEKISTEFISQLLDTVMDPELPVLSIADLGIIRDIRINDEKIIIVITPTYTGCPAMDIISMNIKMVLLENGIKDFEIQTVLSPAWTTDWMSGTGKEKLKAYGIAPPVYIKQSLKPDAFLKGEAIQCPHCDSCNTTLISMFGSTACKALYKCEDCKEPFDHFKCH